MDDDSATESLISVVIPLYNEGSHVKELLSDLKKALHETGCRLKWFSSTTARRTTPGCKSNTKRDKAEAATLTGTRIAA